MFKDKIINKEIKIDPENKDKIHFAKKDVTPQPKTLSEQSMRPGYILFLSSSQFHKTLKIISTKNEPEYEVNNLNSSSDSNNKLKIELVVRTGNIELMAHDFDEMLKNTSIPP